MTLEDAFAARTAKRVSGAPGTVTPAKLRALIINGLRAAAGPLDVYDATTAPTADDDQINSSGNGVFAIGSHWFNQTTGVLYVCRDAGEHAAVWTVANAGVGFAYTWDDTIAAGDPGSGFLRFNNATLASVTAIYMSETAIDGAIGGYLSAAFASGSATKALVRVSDAASRQNFLAATVTGHADGGAYRTLTVTVTATGGSFTSGAVVLVEIAPVGDAGSEAVAERLDTTALLVTDYNSATENGWYSAESGATNEPAAIDSIFEVIAVDANNLVQVVHDRVSDAVYMRKRASGTFDSWSRVRLTEAEQDARYATTGSAILKGDGSGGFSSAAAGTDYCAATSGSSVLKGDGSGGTTAAAATDLGAGKHGIWIPAAAMTPRTTNGAASGTTELATNDVMLSTLDYDATTEEGAGFMLAMPKSWAHSGATMTYDAYWTAGSGSGGVAFGLAAYALSNDDAMDVAVSGQQVVTDTLLTANDMHITSESSAITIGGTPAQGDVVYFEVTREVANGSDTLAVDAKLIGIMLYITTNAITDA